MSVLPTFAERITAYKTPRVLGMAGFFFLKDQVSMNSFFMTLKEALNQALCFHFYKIDKLAFKKTCRKCGKSKNTIFS